jgi:hypothetical protein
MHFPIMPPVQKIEVALAWKDGEKGEDGEKEAVATAMVSMRSSLTKTNCGDSKCAAKGNVQ